jgi:hypothetical protein
VLEDVVKYRSSHIKIANIYAKNIISKMARGFP